MTGTKGLKMWCFTLLQYDEFGRATVIKSFMKPAKDSSIKSGAKKKKEDKAKTFTSKVDGEVDLF